MKTKRTWRITIALLVFSILIGSPAAISAYAQRDFDEFDDFNDTFIAPSLSGAEITFDSAHFRIHYTTTGIDAVSGQDANGNGAPDFVEEVARTLEQVRDIEINQLGWVAPPSDRGFGGNGLYDVYLLEMLSDGTAGFVDGGFSETIVGDNPNSPNVVETRASFSLMGLDNDYAEADEFEDGSTPLGLLRSTAAHEYLHAIQMGYDGEEPADWLWEATATWIQDEVFDDINDANSIIADFVDAPSICQVDADPYAMWIFFRYISEKHGHDTVRSIWEHARTNDGYDAIEAALAQRGDTLDNVIRGFAVSLLTRNFEEGADYPTVKLEATTNGLSFSPEEGIEQIAYDFVELNAQGVNTISLDSATLQAIIVGFRNGQANVFTMQNGQASVDAAQFDHLYLVVVNLQRTESPDACRATDYAVQLTAGGQLDTPAQLSAAPNFQAPGIGELSRADLGFDDFDDFDDRDEFDESDFIDPPTHLIPNYLPAGFAFEEAFEDVFEGVSETVVIFGNDENFMEIIASDTSFRTLDEWIQDLDFEPFSDEIKTIFGVEVLVEDWSEPGDPYFNAAFIRGGQLIEVGITLNERELLKVVNSLLSNRLPRLVGGNDAMNQQSLAFTQIQHKSIGVHRGFAFEVRGTGIVGVQVHVFDLSGELVFKRNDVGNTLRWQGQDANGNTLANGVYLYVVTIQGSNGETLRSEVKKLAVLH